MTKAFLTLGDTDYSEKTRYLLVKTNDPNPDRGLEIYNLRELPVQEYEWIKGNLEHKEIKGDKLRELLLEAFD